jgi:aryl-alcohol dehydrogenase-like predicted oxidoreductase
MRYKLLGKSGLRVSELCLGTMTFGENWGWGAAKEECVRQFDTFVKAGGNFIDTANRYTEGHSEQIVGELIASDRDYFVLATKYTLYTRRDDPNASGNGRKNMMRSVEDSLRRLKTDHIDLYWLHAWDGTTQVEEVMRALDDLVRQGKVLYIGISDTPAWIVARANTLAELRGWSPFVGLQIEYSLIERAAERDLIPMAQALGLGVTPWSPLGAGVLTGKYNTPSTDPKRIQGQDRHLNERTLKIAEVVMQVAAEVGRSPAEVALRWLMQQPFVNIPIIGGRTAEQIAQNLNCLTITLTPEQMATLDNASKIELGFPHDFLKQDSVQNLMLVGLRD